ncbi:g10188 [Coccomyxa elongata]
MVVKLGRAACSSDDADQSVSRSARDNQLSATIRRKKAQVEAQIDELGMDALQERLESAAQLPAQPSYRLSTLIQDIRLQAGRPVLIIEIAKPTPSSAPEDVGRLAEKYAGWGADALAVLTDLEFTSSGYADLVAACRAARIPVLQRDWILHPIQIVDAKEAGAAGVLGTIASVSVKGAPVLSSFAAALGLDAPVEVVNKLEVEAMGNVGVPFFGINLAVGLSLALPGFTTDMTKGLLGALPQGASSVVGVTSIEEAVKAHAAGADAVLVKRDMLVDAEREGKVDELLERLKYATCGDD